MSGTARKGFQLITDEEAPAQTAEPTPAAAAQQQATQVLLLALAALSKRTLTAITNLFTVGLVLSVWLLASRVLDDPKSEQLILLAGFAMFCIVIDVVRRRTK